MAQENAATLDLLNGGAENGSTKTVSFSSLKPQFVLQASKAADAVQFYKTAFGAEEFKRVMYPKRREERAANSGRGRSKERRRRLTTDRRWLSRTLLKQEGTGSSCFAARYRGKQRTEAWILRLPSLQPDRRLLCSGWLQNKLDDEEGVKDIEDLNSAPYWSNDLDHDIDEQEACVHIGDGDSSDTMIRTSKEDKWENNNS
uniref:Glyoxalase At5g48480-like N-terminal domain-containing protein n=1 Tax=Nelumbo nucifera TaxID=4432 RepID=A0A822YMV1_NELNU|nr:TPA_asm: hypothetical protein HUJ06_012254 [Nelumbo nucifera]